MNERRAFPRRTIDLPILAAASAEAMLPPGQAVDLSRGGLLVAFVEPLGFVNGQRMLITVPSAAGGKSEGSRFHALASVVRCDRGADFRTYVVVEFVNLDDDDYDEICRRLDEEHRCTA